MSDIRQRVYTRCSEVDVNGKINVLNGSIIENLLLFDTFILNSIRLNELPNLITLFGFEGVKELLNCGGLKIHCEAISIGQIGQTKLTEHRVRKGTLPLCSYSFATLYSTNQKEYIHNCFKVVDEISELKGKQKVKFKEIISNNFIIHPEQIRYELISQLNKDLENNELSFKASLSLVIKHEKGLDLSPSQIQMVIHKIDDRDFRIESNLKELLHITLVDEHKLIEKALLAIGGRNQKIIEMKNFNALTGFKENEVFLFENKLDFLIKQFSSNSNTESLRRVMTIKGLPDFQHAVIENRIDVEKFLKLHQSNEVKEFRAWIYSINDATDEEIIAYTNSFKEKVGGLIKSPLGKTIRWIAGTGLGFIPGSGTAISASIGFLDTFLLEKILPSNGAIVFLNNMMPSIFKDNE